MQEIIGQLLVIVFILLVVAIFVIHGKCQVLQNQNSILERQVKRMQQKNDGLEERVKMQSEIIKNLSDEE